MMAGDAIREDTRYWAFISYSHKDAAFGRKLHKRLEGYLLPQRLVGRETARGTVPRRLAPIFRDREELPAANDLSAEVHVALQHSRSLIVVCSPAAAASPWVARETETFRALHPERPVFAAIANGEPAESFPAPLYAVAPDGNPVEPLAADFRPHHDGAGLGLLKLVAGIAGISLDELVQRDAQRKTRRVTVITAAALATVLLMSALTIFALNARTEAVRQRGEAEGLVEFMLTDLRDKLKGVGRLDIMYAVNERALHHYAGENLDSLPVDSLERRARILHAMGEDDETRGDHELALAKFREASRTTAALLAQAPNDPDRIFDHAQSEYWIGDAQYEMRRKSAALASFQAYKRLAQQLVAIAPHRPEYMRELGYADGNLCTIDLYPPANGARALHSCRAALVEMETAVKGLGRSAATQIALVNRHAWLADAYRAVGDRQSARAERLLQEGMLQPLMSNDPKNVHLQQLWVALQRALALLDADSGDTASARGRLSRTLGQLHTLIAFDPSNKYWSRQDRSIRAELRSLETQREGKNEPH